MTQRYAAEFHGRPKHSIGASYFVSTFVDGDTPEAAQLALYDEYEHLLGVRLTPLVLRYAPTSLASDGTRRLSRPAQGRYMNETAAEAQAWIDAVKVRYDSPHDSIRTVYGLDPVFEVRPVWCWPGHLDPIGIYFDLEQAS